MPGRVSAKILLLQAEDHQDQDEEQVLDVVLDVDVHLWDAHKLQSELVLSVFSDPAFSVVEYDT